MYPLHNHTLFVMYTEWEEIDIQLSAVMLIHLEQLLRCYFGGKITQRQLYKQVLMTFL